MNIYRITNKERGIFVARPIIRWAFFVIIFTLPFWNGFRMDIDNEKLYLFGFQLSYEAGYLFFVFLMLFLMAFLSLAMIIYRAFCQYACPHNTLSMLLNKIEAKFGEKGKAITFLDRKSTRLNSSHH